MLSERNRSNSAINHKVFSPLRLSASCFDFHSSTPSWWKQTFNETFAERRNEERKETDAMIWSYLRPNQQNGIQFNYKCSTWAPFYLGFCPSKAPTLDENEENSKSLAFMTVVVISVRTVRTLMGLVLRHSTMKSPSMWNADDGCSESNTRAKSNENDSAKTLLLHRPSAQMRWHSVSVYDLFRSNFNYIKFREGFINSNLPN